MSLFQHKKWGEKRLIMKQSPCHRKLPIPSFRHFTLVEQMLFVTNEHILCKLSYKLQNLTEVEQ